MTLRKLSIEDFVKETASSEPVPGGGSVAALVAAVSAALAEMVAGLTIGKQRYAAVEEKMRRIQEEAAALSKDLLEDIDRDSEAYRNVFAAFKMPKETEEEKASRSEAIQERTKEAALVPMSVARKAYKLIPLAEQVLEEGNNNAITDACTAVMAARNAVLGALLNVRINLCSLKDKAFVQELEREAEQLEKDVIQREKLALEKTWKALA